jgi:hypothetical protein
MKEQNLTFELTDNDAIIVDFDNDPNHTAKYQIGVAPQVNIKGDQVVFCLNKLACKAFARLFA